MWNSSLGSMCMFCGTLYSVSLCYHLVYESVYFVYWTCKILQLITNTISFLCVIIWPLQHKKNIVFVFIFIRIPGESIGEISG